MNDQTHATVTAIATLPTPLKATRNNKPVSVLALGNQDGKSPVYFGIDAQGIGQWESVTEFVITDDAVLPKAMAGSMR